MTVGRMGIFFPWLIHKTRTLNLPGYLNDFGLG